MWNKQKQVGVCLLVASPAATLAAIHGLQINARSMIDVAMIVVCLLTSALGGYLLGSGRDEEP